MEIRKLEDFIKNMPENITGIVQKARYLYLELGKRSFYDPEYKYFMFGEESQNLTYINKPYSNPNIIICTTLARQYKHLLDIAGISNSIIFDEEKHCSNYFQDENGVIHETDITQDLKNIQFGCSTNYFAVDTISQERLRQLDIDLGYISEQSGYSNEYWYIIKDAITDESLTDKQRLELIFANLDKLGDPKKPGIVEAFSIYQKFIRYAMPNSDSISIYSMKNSPYEQEKCVVELIQTTGNIKYILNPKSRKFETSKSNNKTLKTDFSSELSER